MSYTSTEEKCLHVRLWTPPLEKLLRKWNRQIIKRSRAHLEVSRVFNRRNYQLGIPTVILSAVTATGGIATFENCDPNDPNSKCVVFEWLRLAFGVLAIFSGILASLHTFLNYQKRAEKHKTAANKYEAMYREIDTLILAPPSMRGDPVIKLQTIKTQYDNIVERFPSLPSSYDIELTYQVENGGVQPPSVGISDSLSDRAGLSDSIVKELMKAMNTERHTVVSEGQKSRTVRVPPHRAASIFDDSDGEDVVIPFDLECERGIDTTIAALAAVKLAGQERSIVDESLSRALEFEMERLNRSDEKKPVADSTKSEEEELEEIVIDN
jgi:hypothetical protein